MAQTIAAKITVEELSKYGFKANGRYVGLSKNLSEADKARLVPGASFEAEYYVADSGKEYLNKILSVASVSVPQARTTEAKPNVDTARAKTFTPSFTKKADATSAGLTKEEWANKDQRISRQGVIQAAVIALAPMVSLERLPVEAMKIAETMLMFVNGAK